MDTVPVGSAEGSERLALEQAALRRVAMLVARATPPEEVFAALAAEVARVLGPNYSVMSRYAPDGTATVVGSWPSEGPARALAVGTRMEPGGRNAHSLVFQTGRPARIDDYTDATGKEAHIARKYGCRTVVGAPIQLEGQLWGGIFVASGEENLLSDDTDAWLAGFAELMATAIANAQARLELRGYAEEQAALRRVAMLVAQATPPEEVFGAVANEIGRLLQVDSTVVSQYDPNGKATVVGAWARSGTAGLAAGTRVEKPGRGVHSLVFQTARPARRDDSAGASDVGRAGRFGAGVGAPISVEGRLWGVIIVGSHAEEPLPADTETRLAGFTELLATAIANAQARMERRRFAEEQAALRRVAVLVARAAPPQEVFTAVADEVGRLLDIDYTVLSRYDGDRAFEVLADWSRDPGHEPGWVGTRFELGGRNIPTLVFETAGPARIDDYSEISGPVSEPVRVRGFRSGVGAPISVGARLWGVMVAASTAEEPLPIGIEARLAAFTELVGTALANAEAQTALTASRARIVAAADEARRRIERDLHDGAQQRLVSLALETQMARADLPPEAREVAARLDAVAEGLADTLDELRELAQGIHPLTLARGGLPDALNQLAHRSAVPVQLDVRVDGRLPEHIELAAYYVVAEALTNAAKHAHASTVDVEVAAGRGALRVSVCDDGRGGADFTSGSGLHGLNDRVDALGGRLTLHSPPRGGTTLTATLPLDIKHEFGRM